MSEPNDHIRENVKRLAEEGLSLWADCSSGNPLDVRSLRAWHRIRDPKAVDGSQQEPSQFIASLLASLPKGTSLCIK